MSLLIYDKELLELMEDFYVVTGMKIGLFDENYNELMAYPAGEKSFCVQMRKNKDFDSLCRKSDITSFCKCQKTHRLNTYKCHAGLIEATAPIIDGERIIGYMVFGQITDNKNRNEFISDMTELCKKYITDTNMEAIIKKIKYRSSKQILAAAKILDACTEYVRLREIIRPSGKQLIDRIDAFINEHISEEITIERLCKEFGISRTRLYELTAPHISGTIGAYIRRKRLSKAKKLLKSGDIAIARVAEEVGFGDYNYFLRVFKKEFGISPKKFAQLQSAQKS